MGAWTVVPVLGCRDVQASAEWYRDTLGFDLDHELGIFSVEGVATYAIVEIEGAGLHLQRRDEEPPIDRGPMHYDAYFSVDGSTDIDELYARFVANGAASLFEPCDEDYGMRDFGISTPDGHRLNFGTPR
jgi:catechol 2,3-dioxygenase-like lactoylglutathione lyase family enzyme